MHEKELGSRCCSINLQPDITSVFSNTCHSQVLYCLFVMGEQVSETENLRKNLAVERMIVEGCDILLDVNQVFVRQGESMH